MRQNERIADSAEVFRQVLDASQSKIWTALPAIVESVDLSRQTISAQPAIRVRVSDENGNVADTQLPLCVDVPLMLPRAGGFSITFPIKSGDEVLLVFSSRCIDAWWQSSGVQSQPDFRMHDLSDAFAILAPTSQPKKLENISATNLQIRNDTGNAIIEIEALGKIKLTSQTEVEIVAPQTKITGAFEVSGSSNLKGATTIQNKQFLNHTHGGVATGGSNTSGVV